MLRKALSFLKGARPVQHGSSIKTSTLSLDYPIHVRKRLLEISSGGKQIAAALKQSELESEKLLRAMAAFRSDLQNIPAEEPQDQSCPFWNNVWIPPLDALSIYTLIRTTQPATYFEVGSGTSTKFARQAITDGALPTRIVSVDPWPRAEIDAICDEVIRDKLEDLDPAIYLDRIRPGDVVFVDNSHRCFQSSDVTVFFTEMLPSLPAQVTWGLHDIFLPYDYPEDWLGRFYNEQYLLATYLLGGHAHDDVIFPSTFCAENAAMTGFIDEIFNSLPLHGLQRSGGCFWMRRKSSYPR